MLHSIPHVLWEKYFFILCNISYIACIYGFKMHGFKSVVVCSHCWLKNDCEKLIPHGYNGPKDVPEPNKSCRFNLFWSDFLLRKGRHHSQTLWTFADVCTADTRFFFFPSLQLLGIISCSSVSIHLNLLNQSNGMKGKELFSIYGWELREFPGQILFSVG